MAGTKSSCFNIRCFYSSTSSDEIGQDHSASAGSRSSPSAIDDIEPLPGSPEPTEALVIPRSNVETPMEYEIGHCDKATVFESQNTQRESEGENVNAHHNVSGATQSNEPSSSGPSNLPVIPEGEHVDVNRDVLKSNLIDSLKHIGQADDGKEMDVDLDKLVDHISKLLKLREEEMLSNKDASKPSKFHWPEGFKNLNAILSFGIDLVSRGVDFASKLKDVISGDVTTILKGIGQASVVTAGLLVVAYTLERVQDLSQNKDKCWVLIKEMSQLAIVVKKLNENPMRTLNVIEEATTLVVEGAITCCTQISHSRWKSFLLTPGDTADLSDIQKRLRFMYMTITVDIAIYNSAHIERLLDIAIRNSDGIERLLGKAISDSAGIERVLAVIENPLVSRIYPEEAVGIDNSIEKVASLLEIESAQKAVTVIVHGFRGMGKTILADAVVSKATVVSKLEGFKYSKVRLSKDPVIENLQNDILKDLMEPGETIRKITGYQEGQRELLDRLKQVQAFIYIDDVLDGKKLKQLLPEDMGTAKNVRLLLTARNEDVKNACPKQSTEPKIYKMEGIRHQEALIILQREIKDGINDDQFKNIIQTCGGIPLMLTLAANFIGSAKNIETAYSQLVLQKKKWLRVAFEEMREAYDALPHDCIEPFLDICSYFKGWAWEEVEGIVGKHKLEMLERTALVTRTNDVAFVHDVILTLAHQKSKEISEGKEVRLTFTSASQLMEFLEEEGAEGIKGIWLSDNEDAFQIPAATLDLMSKSLRVLRLGNLTRVEGKCSKRFQELVFLEANVCEIPFHDVSKLKKLSGGQVQEKIPGVRIFRSERSGASFP